MGVAIQIYWLWGEPASGLHPSSCAFAGDESGK
jgi:hypothetical protein